MWPGVEREFVVICGPDTTQMHSANGGRWDLKAG